MGRFTGIDPLASKYYSWSAYHYAYNNPNRYIDPNGMEIVNGDAIERDKQKAIMDHRKGILNSIKEKTGGLSNRKLAKAGLSGSEIKNIKNLKGQYKEAKRSYEFHAGQASITQDKIANLASESPNLFNKINNLSVDAMIMTDPNLISGKSNYGQTEFATKDETIPTSNFGENSLIIKLDNTSSNKVFRHELGHFEYQATNTYSYRSYINDLMAKGLDIQGGHRKDDQSGLLANQYESIIDIKKE